MIEHRPLGRLMSHLIIIVGLLVIAFPVWITIVAATHDSVRVTQVPFPLLPGDQFFINLKSMFSSREEAIGGIPVGMMMLNSLVMALSIGPLQPMGDAEIDELRVVFNVK